MTEPADAIEARDDSAELQPMLQSGYITIAITEKTRVRPWNVHINA